MRGRRSYRWRLPVPLQRANLAAMQHCSRSVSPHQVITFERCWAYITLPRHPLSRRRFVTEINKDEKTVVARSDFNVANVIAAIALLLVVLGGLKYFGVSPI
jgi:hypothetical protein